MGLASIKTVRGGNKNLENARWIIPNNGSLMKADTHIYIYINTMYIHICGANKSVFWKAVFQCISCDLYGLFVCLFLF